jgi:glycosyltransferase involved in cell wall biosynthesis
VKRIGILLAGPVAHDSRVIKTVRALAEHARVDLYYLDGAERDRRLFPASVRLMWGPSPQGLQSRILRLSFFHREHDQLRRWVLESRVKYDVIYANDLPTLQPAVGICRALGARLVYDAHEIYVETLNQFGPTRRGSIKTAVFDHACLPVMRSLGRAAERRLLRDVDAMVTVNHPLAAYFHRFYGVHSLTVVHNYPPRLTRIPTPVLDFRQAFGWTQRQRVFLYQGTLNRGRALGPLLHAVARAGDEIVLVVIGEGPMRAELQSLAGRLGVAARARFMPLVPADDLPAYTVGADFGVNLLEELNLSKYLATPTKLFQYLQVGLPVICSDVPENRRILEQCDIGILTSNSIADITDALQSLASDEERASRLRRNCALAAERYTWESQLPALRRAVDL